MNTCFKTVSMIGLGYIGLPTAAVIASHGLKVIGVDVNQAAVDIINSGKIHFVEPDLESVVHEVVRNGNLRATTLPEMADAYLIAVPTPFKGDKEPDLSYVEAAARAIAPVLQKGNLVVLESTSPVGATEQMAAWLAQARPDLLFPQQVGEAADINVAYCPERVLPGQVIHELVHNDRVIGGMTKLCAERAKLLYKTFVMGECLVTGVRTAEMCKLTENSSRDVSIAFANELSIICDELAIDVWELIALANRHPRVNILNPGPGVGGHCIAVDPWFIVYSAPASSRLIRTAREVNDGKPGWVVNKIATTVSEMRRRLDKDVVVACLGLAFKADIDDLRESPSLEIVQQISNLHFVGQLLVVEPYIDHLPHELSDRGINKLVGLEEALEQADMVVLLVDHKLFRMVNRACLNGKIVIDTRGIWR